MALNGGSGAGAGGQTYTRFLQKAGNGNWAVFRYRDDLDERRPYWALTTTGALQYVDPWDGGAPTASRFANDQQRRGGDSDPRGWTGLKYQPPTAADPLAGDESAGRALSDDSAMLAAVHKVLSGKGISGEKVRSDATAAGDMLDWAHSQVGWEKSEATGKPLSVAEAFIGQRGASSFPRIDFSNLDYFSPNERTSFKGVVDGMPVGKSPAVSPPSVDAALGRSPTGPALNGNVASGGGAGTPPGGTATLPPGKFNGETVDADMLKTYLTTQWEPVFNAWVGNFRDAGAAGYFLNWLSRASNTFLGQYEGFLGKQALAGKVPEGDFASFLSAKAKGITNAAGAEVGQIGGDPGAKTFGTATDSVNRAVATAAAKAKADAAAAPVAWAAPPPDLSGTTVNPSADAERIAREGLASFLPKPEFAYGGVTTAPVIKVGDPQRSGVPNPETLYNPENAPLYIVPDNGGTPRPTEPDIDYDKGQITQEEIEREKEKWGRRRWWIDYPEPARGEFVERPYAPEPDRGGFVPPPMHTRIVPVVGSRGATDAPFVREVGDYELAFDSEGRRIRGLDEEQFSDPVDRASVWVDQQGRRVLSAWKSAVSKVLKNYGDQQISENEAAQELADVLESLRLRNPVYREADRNKDTQTFLPR